MEEEEDPEEARLRPKLGLYQASPVSHDRQHQSCLA